MKGSVSPAVIVVVVVILLAVVGAVGYKMLGTGKAADNMDPAMKQKYMQGQQNPEQKAADELKHMNGGAGAPAGAGR